MTRSPNHPSIKCSVSIAKLLGARKRRIGEGWPLGFALIRCDDGTFWLLALDTAAYREAA